MSAAAIAEHHAEPEPTGFKAQRHAQVCLADARRAEQERIGAVRDEAHRRELLDHFRIDRGLHLPVKIVERLLEREARHLDAHRLVLLLLGRDFGGEHGLQKGAVADLLLRGLLQESGQALRDAHQT